MRALKTTAWLVIAGVILMSVASALWLFFDECNINLVKSGSRLEPVINPRFPRAKEDIVESVVLAQLPVGSDRNAIRHFLESNFTQFDDRIRIKPPFGAWGRAWRGGLYHPRDPFIFARPIDIESLADAGTLEIYLLLDQNQKLKRVVVKSYYASL